jgi:putative methylase
MTARRALTRRLEPVRPFEDPILALEQYPTPADIAAHLCHLADLHDDVRERTVVDLGTGTGVLALAAACRSPRRVLGLEIDPDALGIARENERRVAPPMGVSWIRGDAAAAPLCPDGPTTVLANPPFGAQDGTRGADRPFLTTAATIADVSYTLHNEGSRGFVESFASDRGGYVTHAFAVEFDVDRQFHFHEQDRRSLSVEAFRIEWTG